MNIEQTGHLITTQGFTDGCLANCLVPHSKWLLSKMAQCWSPEQNRERNNHPHVSSLCQNSI